jgi:hypothetical protein
MPPGSQHSQIKMLIRNTTAKKQSLQQKQSENQVTIDLIYNRFCCAIKEKLGLATN